MSVSAEASSETAFTYIHNLLPTDHPHHLSLYVEVIQATPARSTFAL